MVTRDDFQSFVDFAIPLINHGNADSLGQLVQQWEIQREHDETVAALKRSYEDMKAGQGTPADEVFAEIRAKLGISK